MAQKIQWIDTTLKGFLDKNGFNSSLFSPACIVIDREVLNNLLEVILLTQKALLGNSSWSTGVCSGYDFHLSHQGLKLIEINTNAGGALLNIERNIHLLENNCLPNNYHFCYSPSRSLEALVKQFEEEGHNQKVNFLAIVDDEPKSQFLYAEFLLFQNKLSQLQHNFKHVQILSPQDLQLGSDNSLTYQGKVVDFIYNRLTDFSLNDSAHHHLKIAYENKKIILSPTPENYKNLADKSHFIHLSSKDWLLSRGLSPMEAETLIPFIPQTEILTQAQKDKFWEKRKNLFFKPTQGYGSKAVYRGDKITHKVFDEICEQNNYIAQEIVPPGHVEFDFENKHYDLKYDLRVYCYKTNAFLVVARLYDGQTTNFRTEAGGFAPVFI